MRCSIGKKFLASTKSPSALENFLNFAISEIRTLLFTSLVPTFSGTPYRLDALGGLAFWVQDRICQVDSRIWHLNFPRGLHGLYKNGKIFLKEGNWCRKTFYHETLHATSIFVRPGVYSSVGSRHKLFSEGITEFLTGFVLSKNNSKCYELWKKGTFNECKLSSYKSKVRLWCSFCNFIPLTKVTNLYFWDGLGTWDSRYAQFLADIQNAGYLDFQDVLSSGANSEMLFTQECIDNFGSDFQIILNSRKKSLDFSTIRESEESSEQ